MLFFFLSLSLPFSPVIFKYECSSMRGKNSLNERNNHGDCYSFFHSLVFLINFLYLLLSQYFPFETTFDVSLNLKRMKRTDNDVDFVNATRHVENVVKSFWIEDLGNFIQAKYYFSYFFFYLGVTWNFILNFSWKNVNFIRFY